MQQAYSLLSNDLCNNACQMEKESLDLIAALYCFQLVVR